MALLEAQQASMTFWAGPPWSRRPVPALREVNLSIGEGEIIGVVGESGSGKSTLGNMLIGRLRASTGTVTYRGRSLADMKRSERAGKFAAVLQHPKWSLNPMLTVADSVVEPLKIMGTSLSKTEKTQRIGEQLEQVGLPGNYQHRYPHELSGGQRQRVSIARALITNPEFVLFDEAVSALDVSVQAQVLNMIKQLQQEAGFSAIFISHDLAATRYVASRIAVFYAGRLVEDAPAETFYGLAQHPYARGLQFASDLVDDPAYELKLDKASRIEVGCPLQHRCPLATDICTQQEPQLQKKGEVLFACHHPLSA